MTPLLKVESIGKTYGRRVGCEDISFELHAGEVLAIVGESGSGKTTLLRCLSGHLQASSGNVTYAMRDGRTVNLADLSEAERRMLMRTDWGFVHQDARDRLIDELQPPAGSKVLEIGCGTGRNIIKAARKYLDVTFHGIDISDEMLKSATWAVGRNNLMHRVKLAQADAVTFNSQHVFGQTGYDRIYFSYTLSMIPDWQGALKNALNQLSPQGELHIVDFGQCEKLPNVWRSVLQRWLAQFHVYPRDTLPGVLAADVSASAKEITFNPLHRGYTWHMMARPIA